MEHSWPSVAHSVDGGRTWYCYFCHERLAPDAPHKCGGLDTVYFLNDKYFTLVNPPEVLGPDGNPVSSENAS